MKNRLGLTTHERIAMLEDDIDRLNKRINNLVSALTTKAPKQPKKYK